MVANSVNERMIQLETRYGALSKTIICSFAMLFLHFGRDVLPVPCNKIITLCMVIIFIQATVFFLTYMSDYIFVIYHIQFYGDIVFAPFVLTFSGGFISPFMVVYISVGFLSLLVYKGKKILSKGVVFYFLASYICVALLQKYEIIPCYLESSCLLMKNDIFFFFILGLNTLILLGSHLFIISFQKKIESHISDLMYIQQKIVSGTIASKGENIFNILVQELADGLQASLAVCGSFDDDGNLINVVSGWENNRTIEPISFQWKDHPLSNAENEESLYMDHFNVKDYIGYDWAFDMQRGCFLGQILKDKSGNRIGVLYVICHIPFTELTIAKTLISIFASRAAVEIEKMNVEEKSELMHERLSQSHKMEALGQLSGGIAHDFNNILNGIMGYSQLLKMKLGDGALLGIYPEKIIALSKKASALTGQLLTFARKEKLHKLPFDTNKSLSEVVNMLEHTIDKSISIRQNLEAQMSTVMGESTLFENMLINLAVNARDAMPNGGELTLSTKNKEVDDVFVKEHAHVKNCKTGSWTIVSVADNGSGIDPKIRKNIFEPFYTTKTKGRGTGLGLAAVDNCVKTHDGFIDVISEPGEGTAFNIYLPVIDQVEFLKKDTGVFFREVKGNGSSILLIDDEVDILESLSESLDLYGYSVKTCINGIEAIALYKKEYSNIDIIILDMNMPKMNGKQVFKELKKINPNLKVLIATGYSVEEDTQQLVSEDGVYDLITKPFHPIKLVKAIEKIVSESKS